jgi:3-hydroxyisobutyrate dehydrogenase
MSRIALLGLGRMGTAMAARLADEGHQLTLWNRSPITPADGAELPGVLAPTPADAVAGVDVAITMLTDAAAVHAVLFGPGGAAGALGPRTVLVDMSTIGPDAVRALRDELPAAVRFVDAPVQGSTPKARAGELVILAGGGATDIADCRPVLDSLGTLRHVGPLGSGAALKLIVNLALGASFVVLAEALRTSDALGLDQEASLDALSGTAIGSLVPRLRGRLADPAAPTQFSLALAAKDLDLVVAASGDSEGATAAAARRLAGAVAAGLGQADITEIAGYIRSTAG